MDQIAAMTVFVAVVEAESFTGAAEKLNLSRTMVSKHVMDLEAHLNARLINRTTRRQSLTGTGRVYFERARRILGEVAEADAEAGRHALTPRGRLRINAPIAFGTLHVAPRLRAYLDRYPEVEIDLTLNDRIVDLVDEGYDLAIRIGDLADSSLIARRIAGVRAVTCAAPEYLARRGVPAHPSELEGHACLAYSYASAPDRWTFRRDGDGDPVMVRVRPRIVSNNGDALAAAAIAGLGVIVQPDFIVEAALRDGRLREILPEYRAAELGIHAVYPSHRLVSARVRTFIDHLVACFGAENPWQRQGASP